MPNVQIAGLAALSARLGCNPLMVQAGSGNTSIKIDGTLWIKASGKWLVRAEEEDIFVPVDLARFGCSISEHEYRSPSGECLTPSIETAMHAVFPHNVVIHVHSVNAVAWAVRCDGPEQLAYRLSGMSWRWIPYSPSGWPLAEEVQKVLDSRPDVLILGNHGLVVGGENCDAALATLEEVEGRLAIPARSAPPPRITALQSLARQSDWRLPVSPVVHHLATDQLSRRIVSEGTLYPCHGMFLGPGAAVLHRGASLRQATDAYRNRYGMPPATLLVEDIGVLVPNTTTTCELEVLDGLSQVVQRIDEQAPLRYLTEPEMANILTVEAHQYRRLVQNGALVPAQPAGLLNTP